MPRRIHGSDISRDLNILHVDTEDKLNLHEGNTPLSRVAHHYIR